MTKQGMQRQIGRLETVWLKLNNEIKQRDDLDDATANLMQAQEYVMFAINDLRDAM